MTDPQLDTVTVARQAHAQAQKEYADRKKQDSDRRCVWVPKDRSEEFTTMFRNWLSSGTD